MSFLDDLLRQIRGGGQPQQQPQARSMPGIPPRQAPTPIQQQPMRAPAQFAGGQSLDNQITNNMVQRGALPQAQMERYPGPAPRRAQGLPQNFLGAPQLPTHDRELYDELLNLGGFNNFRGF